MFYGWLENIYYACLQYIPTVIHSVSSEVTVITFKWFDCSKKKTNGVSNMTLHSLFFNFLFVWRLLKWPYYIGLIPNAVHFKLLKHTRARARALARTQNQGLATFGTPYCLSASIKHSTKTRYIEFLYTYIIFFLSDLIRSEECFWWRYS